MSETAVTNRGVDFVCAVVIDVMLKEVITQTVDLVTPATRWLPRDKAHIDGHESSEGSTS